MWASRPWRARAEQARPVPYTYQAKRSSSIIRRGVGGVDVRWGPSWPPARWEWGRIPHDLNKGNRHAGGHEGPHPQHHPPTPLRTTRTLWPNLMRMGQTRPIPCRVALGHTIYGTRMPRPRSLPLSRSWIASVAASSGYIAVCSVTLPCAVRVISSTRSL